MGGGSRNSEHHPEATVTPSLRTGAIAAAACGLLLATAGTSAAAQVPTMGNHDGGPEWFERQGPAVNSYNFSYTVNSYYTLYEYQGGNFANGNQYIRSGRREPHYATAPAGAG